MREDVLKSIVPDLHSKADSLTVAAGAVDDTAGIRTHMETDCRSYSDYSF